jgi:RND family efflux transporter MFP subunit
MAATVSPKERRVARLVARIALGLALAAGTVLLILGLMGHFHPKVNPAAAPPPQTPLPAGAATATVKLLTVPVTESAVGTIRPVYEAAVASKLLEKVLEVNAKAGAQVSEGDVLIRLEDIVLRTLVQRAESAMASATASRNQARTELDSLRKAFEASGASKLEVDRADTAVKTADAELARAEQALREATTNLSFTVIRSPITGTVVDKKVNAGDTVVPGQVLVTVFDPTRMQLVATVRESLTQRLKPGQLIDVRLDSLNKTCRGTVSEIVPEAQSASRSFSVKVTGPCQPGIYAGMFGRLIIPLDTAQVVAIPASAVTHVGQIETADVVADDAGRKVLRRRAVQLGRPLEDGLVEVLSGLRPGEIVLARAAEGR